MKQFLGYAKTVNRTIAIGLGLALLIYFSIELWLINLPPLFPHAYELGQFTLKVSQAYITSFIFYFLVVHIKSQKDKSNINEYVALKVSDIITCSSLFFTNFQPRNETNKVNLDDRNELGSLLRTIKRDAPDAPLILRNGDHERNGTWMEWFEYLKESIDKDLEELFLRIPYLESDLIKKLTRIQASMFFSMWDMLKTNQYDPTFHLYTTQILTYRALVKDLENYAEKKFKGMQYQTSEFLGYKKEFHPPILAESISLKFNLKK